MNRVEGQAGVDGLFLFPTTRRSARCRRRRWLIATGFDSHGPLT
jgi:hypothetical protein